MDANHNKTLEYYLPLSTEWYSNMGGGVKSLPASRKFFFVWFDS